jgi:hypothetical protein
VIQPLVGTSLGARVREQFEDLGFGAPGAPLVAAAMAALEARLGAKPSLYCVACEAARSEVHSWGQVPRPLGLAVEGVAEQFGLAAGYGPVGMESADAAGPPARRGGGAGRGRGRGSTAAHAARGGPAPGGRGTPRAPPGRGAGRGGRR